MTDNRVLLAKDIEDIYTKVVNSYLEKGFYINIGTMSGSQSGEMAKVDVTNGKDVYRIALLRDIWTSEDMDNYPYCSGNKIALSVEKFEGKAQNKMEHFNTLWNGQGKSICLTEWFELGSNKYTAYTNNLNFACECQMLNLKRREARGNVYSYTKTKTKTFNLSDKQRAIVADMCRHTRGYMKIKDSDIDRLDMSYYTREKAFTVYFSNGKPSLTIGRIRG